ncbi:hypothetical protein 2 [Sanxia water strider virus 7]|uniref:hypothetical protein 2 n=1 Tax=Sanxia water strider virus 7 TaxID=1923406 RepID=UPI00090B88D2|nr:hypothetical protein 2 [Sanxia water strider virus 7]APG77461.1 hypothetical protein 2 [Sanxia water strider virus 7]
MSDPHGDPAPVDRGGVISVEVSEESSGKPDFPTSIILSRFCSVESEQVYKDLLNTWSILPPIIWEGTTDAVTTYNLPYYAVESLKDYPQMLPFRMYQYWRGDIEIRATVAGSPFAIGQQQMAWYYDATHDSMFDVMRKNKYARSTMLHTLIDASPSNDAVLYIPYKSYRSFLQTRTTREEQGKPLDLGTLQIGVLNELLVPDGATKQVSLVLHIRFPNSEFQGRVSTALPGHL